MQGQRSALRAALWLPSSSGFALQLPLINKAKAAFSAVWAPSSPSCFQKQGGQPHQAVCAVWAVLSFDTLLFFNKQLFPVAHASTKITTLGSTVPVLGRTLPGMSLFLRQQQIVSCTRRWPQQVTASTAAVSAQQLSSYYGHLRIRPFVIQYRAGEDLERSFSPSPALHGIADNQPLPGRCLSYSLVKTCDDRGS